MYEAVNIIFLYSRTATSQRPPNNDPEGRLVLCALATLLWLFAFTKQLHRLLEFGATSTKLLVHLEVCGCEIDSK